MAVTGDEADQLFQRLEAEQVHVFYAKAPIEFAVMGAPRFPTMVPTCAQFHWLDC